MRSGRELLTTVILPILILASSIAASIAAAADSDFHAARHRLMKAEADQKGAARAKAPALKKSAAAAFLIDTTTSTQKLFQRLARDPLPPSVTLDPMTLYGERTQSGLYQGFPVLAGNVIPDGIVLSTGNVNDINDEFNKISSPGVDTDEEPEAGFQRQDIITIANNTANVDLRPPISLYGIYDPSSYSIPFTTTAQTKSFSVDFMYGTEEFPYFLKSIFNDIFLIFLDGKNIAFDSDQKAISVGNDFFKVVNVDTIGGILVQEDIVKYINPEVRIGGFTLPLRAQANLAPGNHTLEFVIVDIGDPSFPSSVFLQNLRFSENTVVPGTREIFEFIEDQVFTVPDTLKPGGEVGVLATAIPKDSLTFSVLSGPPAITVDARTGRLAVAPGVSLVPLGGQTLTYRVVAANQGRADTATIKVNVLVTQGHPPPPPPPPPPEKPPLLSATRGVYLDADGDGHIDQAMVEFAASPRRAPERVGLADPFTPAATAAIAFEVAGASIVRVDSAHFRLAFPEREFAFGTAFPTGLLATLLAPDSVFGNAPFPVEDGVGPLPTLAEAIGPQKLADKPTLTVLFSESVSLDTAAKAFPYLIKRPGQDLGPVVVESIHSLGGNKFLYTFSSPDYPLPGDSLQAVTGNPHLEDARGNKVRMSYYIPVVGKHPVPSIVLRFRATGIVTLPPMSHPVRLNEAVLVEPALQPGVCIGCQDPARLAAFHQVTAGQPLGESLPFLAQVRTSGPIRYKLRFFSNRGEVVNRAEGVVDAGMLQSVPKDGDGNYLFNLYWWPVSPRGQMAGTGAYILRGSILGEGEVDLLAPVEAGFTHLPNEAGNVSLIFGFIRR
ncbi:MAG: choice-of-anchor L domain-containing protein [Fibrobacteria bacterium]